MGASAQGVFSAQRQASWISASRPGSVATWFSARTRLAVEPRGFDDQRLTTPTLGQTPAEVAQVGAEVRQLHPLPGCEARSPRASARSTRDRRPQRPTDPAREAARLEPAAPGSGSPASRARVRAAMLTATECLQRRWSRLTDDAGQTSKGPPWTFRHQPDRVERKAARRFTQDPAGVELARRTRAGPVDGQRVVLRPRLSGAALITSRESTGRRGRCSSPSTRVRSSPAC